MIIQFIHICSLWQPNRLATHFFFLFQPTSSVERTTV